MQPILAGVAAAILLALSACGNLPPGHPPIQPNAAQGGGAAYLDAKPGVGY